MTSPIADDAPRAPGAPDEGGSGVRSRRWLAALLSLTMAGAGQVALGRTERALVWILATLASAATVLIGALGSRPALMWAGVLLGVFVWLFGTLETVWLRPGPLPAGRTVLLAWIVLLGFWHGSRWLGKQYLVEAYRIPSVGMVPTLAPGDRLFVDKRARRPARGDVIVLRYPRDPRNVFIKRVVAVGGDRVSFEGGELFVDGKKVPQRRLTEPCQPRCVAFSETIGSRTYTVARTADGGFPRSSPPLVVPEGHVYVLGDNRDNSHDSRYWGTVPADHVLGRALFIWWSSNASGIRWDRMGRPVR